MVCPSCGAATTDSGNACPTCGAVVGATITSSGMTFTNAETIAPPSPGQPAFEVLQPGQQFGPRYRIIKLKGAGGMGAVYHAGR